MARPFAVFDIDGTFLRWQLYHAVADELARQGYLDEKCFSEVKQARRAWKEREDEASFREYENMLVDVFRISIANIRVDDHLAACRAVIERYKHQTYTYTRNLVRQLKEQNYLLFAISGSQAEIVKMLADYYNFDDSGGTIYEIKNGHYTGKSQILKSENKPIYLKQLVNKHNATWENSVGVGDSEGDIDMLSTVERPIAFNPNKPLFEHAKKQQWRIVLERKNMIYKLEPKDGNYQLSD